MLIVRRILGIRYNLVSNDRMCYSERKEIDPQHRKVVLWKTVVYKVICGPPTVYVRVRIVEARPHSCKGIPVLAENLVVNTPETTGKTPIVA